MPLRYPNLIRDGSRFLQSGHFALDRGHHLVKDLICMWVPGGGVLKELHRKYSAVGVFYDQSYITSLTTTTGGTLGNVMQCAPTNNKVLANSGYARQATLNTTFDSVTGSIEVWFKINALMSASNDNQVLVYRADTSTGRNGLGIYCNYLSASNTRLAAFIRNNAGTSTDLAEATANLAVGVWYHACLTFNSAGTSSLYLNGRLTATTGSTVTFTWNAADIWHGANDIITGAFWSALNGQIAKVGWYNRAFNASEVYALSRHPGVMLKSNKRVPTYADAAGLLYADQGFNANVTFASTFAREPFVQHTLTFGNTYFLTDVFTRWNNTVTFGSTFTYFGELEKVISQTVTFTNSFQLDQEFTSILSFPDETTFTLPEVYGIADDTVRFRSTFTGHSNELWNGIYRR